MYRRNAEDASRSFGIEALHGPVRLLSPISSVPCAIESARAMRTTLSDLEIRRALGTLPGWVRKGEALSKTYSFARFADGIRFVDQVAKVADEMNHHPDIDIRYTHITFALSSHDAGGITQRDLDLAQKIEKAAGFDQKPGA